MPAPDDGLGGITVTQERIDSDYLRSVNSFWCPFCKEALQRPTPDSMSNQRGEWQYRCDNPLCPASGTRAEIEIMAAPIEAMWGSELCLPE